MDESSMIHNRRKRRSPVLLSASIEVAGDSKPVRLRNLSEDGALIEGECLPEEGSETFFERKELRLKSRVIWVHGRYAGVAFARPLMPEDVLRHIPSPKAKVQIEAKRPGLACRPLTSYERRMLERWMAAPSFNAVGE